MGMYETLEYMYYFEIINHYILPVLFMIVAILIPIILLMINSKLKKINKNLNVIANNTKKEEIKENIFIQNEKNLNESI